MELLEQLAYSKRVRRKFFERMALMPWDEVAKNREASFYSMKNIMLHMIDNEDWIVNWVIPGRRKEYSRRKSEEYKDISMMRSHLKDVEARSESELASLGRDGMQRPVEFVLGSGEGFELSVEECLFQTFTEQLYHLGELIALFWQQDVEPPKMQWFYNRARG